MRGIRNFFVRFMAGRYGVDKLNNVLLWSSVIVVLVTMFLPLNTLRLVLMVISYALMGWAVFRCFSRNTYKRYRENRRFLMLLDRIRDRSHRYYSCPRCRQPVRVPRGKGKISITCPKCSEKFIKKT
ncbi:MAG: hypothetical protein E7466_06050 [Ruminococcaceae bacterium]|nr:hypothetical protein [Oscillospiraceae bacterium]MBQ3215387.1 hypothetical protein [Oscillospiraceae bacterium]